MTPDDRREWLGPDGLGGFASGTASGIRSRRYHALLLTATTPPAGRFVLVNGLEAWLETAAGRIPLSSQRYEPDVVHPDGTRRIERFDADPWPRWTFRLDEETRLEHEVLVAPGRARVVLGWRLAGEIPGPTTLCVRPLLSGRDPHALHHENATFRFDAEPTPGGVAWRPYDGLPSIHAASNGTYTHDP